ncbi:hypothetical protein Lepto7376_2200 [[Leptolyngbya] sp. PCC 7376]|nr:hypothetical protein Lepto7376_2200 [[Leptolyngbya] sp. PCC 7376]
MDEIAKKSEGLEHLYYKQQTSVTDLDTCPVG